MKRDPAVRYVFEDLNVHSIQKLPYHFDRIDQ